MHCEIRPQYPSRAHHSVRGAGLSLVFVTTTMAAHLLPLPVRADPFPFTKVVDTDTRIPGAAGNFSYLAGAPLDAGNLAFYGSVGVGDAHQAGIYTSIDGTISLVADFNTPIPGGSGNFKHFFGADFDDGHVVFRANGENEQQGIYTDLGGSLRVVADRSTAVPGGTGTFRDLRSYAIDGEQIVLGGRESGSPGNGIYMYSANTGGLDVVVPNTPTPRPGGGGTFRGGLNLTLDDGNVAFMVGLGPGGASRSGSGSGIYAVIDGALQVIVDLNTPIPDAPGGTFSSAYAPSLSGRNVAFGAPGVGRGFSIYLRADDEITLVADHTTGIADGASTFPSFSGPSLDGTNVAFRATDLRDWDGIYLSLAGSLMKVIDTDDPLDGKAIDALFIGGEALDGDQLAFTAWFTDGSRGIYIATIPEPATLALLALGAAALLRRRRSL